MLRVSAVIALFCLVALPAIADPYSWQWSFGPYGRAAYMGTSPNASDDHDQLDLPLASNPYINIAVYRESGENNWTGAEGFYSKDVRTPLDMIPGASKTWRIYYWNNPSSPANWTQSDFTWQFVSTDGAQPPTNIEYKLTFVRLPVGMNEWDPPSSYASPVLDETVILNDRVEGNWVLWSYRTDNGLDGYVFDLTATVTPEPSSLVALGMGALPLAGMLVLRRRRPLISD